MKREKFILTAVLTVLFFSSLLLAQQNGNSANVSLLNYDEVKNYLNLDFDQQKTIEPLIKEIININQQV